MKEIQLTTSLRGLKKCDSCGEVKESVEYRENPYMADIYNESVYENICNECFQQMCEDI